MVGIYPSREDLLGLRAKVDRTFTRQGPQPVNNLAVFIHRLVADHGHPPIDRDEVYKEIFEQAENFKKHQVQSNG
jgi:type I restriction enzyme R subunit